MQLHPVDYSRWPPQQQASQLQLLLTEHEQVRAQIRVVARRQREAQRRRELSYVRSCEWCQLRLMARRASLASRIRQLEELTRSRDEIADSVA